jgi:glycosyltransferase involved in cell wall biosynthesis
MEEIEGVKIFRVGPKVRYIGQTPPKIYDNFGYMLAAAIKGLQVIGKFRISIMHANTYAPAFSAALCALLFRKPWVVTVHDVFFMQGADFWAGWASQNGLGRGTGIIGPIAEKFLLRLSPNIFHTVSAETRGDLSRNRVMNIRVIPNGIDLREYDGRSESSQKKQLLYLGRLVNYKNLEVVIEAMKCVREQVPDSYLVIAGDGPHRARLEKLVKDCGLEMNVSFVGFVTHERKVSLLRESAFLVLPSTAEGFGMAVAEAFACGRPALVSNLASLAALVADGVDGRCISPFDSILWSEAILELLRDEQRTAVMGMNALRKAERYSLKKTVDDLEQLYRELTGEGIACHTEW